MIIDHMAEQIQDPELKKKLQVMQIGSSSKSSEAKDDPPNRKREKKSDEKAQQNS